MSHGYCHASKEMPKFLVSYSRCFLSLAAAIDEDLVQLTTPSSSFSFHKAFYVLDSQFLGSWSRSVVQACFAYMGSQVWSSKTQPLFFYTTGKRLKCQFLITSTPDYLLTLNIIIRNISFSPAYPWPPLSLPLCNLYFNSWTLKADHADILVSNHR